MGETMIKMKRKASKDDPYRIPQGIMMAGDGWYCPYHNKFHPTGYKCQLLAEAGELELEVKEKKRADR